MKVQFLGQVTEVYQKEETGNKTVTCSDSLTGGVCKFRAGPGLAVKLGQYYRFDLDLVGKVGKGFQVYYEYAGGTVKPVTQTFSE